MLSFGMHRVTCHQGCHWNPCHPFTIFIKTIVDTHQCKPHGAQLLVWFQLRAVLQVKAALTAILYPAVHFLPDYLIRIKIQISETLHSCSWLIFLQNMSKPFFRPGLQGQFLFWDFLYIAFFVQSYRMEWLAVCMRRENVGTKHTYHRSYRRMLGMNDLNM